MVTKAKIGLLAVLGLLTACATPVRWEKAGVSDVIINRDTAQCRSFAASEANRSYQRDYPSVDRGINGPTDSFRGTMAQNDAVLFQNKVFNDCMRSHGYSRTDGDRAP